HLPHRHAIGSRYPRLAAEQIDALAVQPLHLAVVRVVGDLEIAPGERRRDIELAGDRLSGAGRVMRLGDRLARAQQRLRRNACPVRALAADELALGDRHPQTPLGQTAGTVLAGRSGAHDDDVVVVIDAHSPPSPLASTPSIYARASLSA